MPKPDVELAALDPRIRLEEDLAAIQERILAAAMERGHDGTTWPLYELVVTLRRYIDPSQ
jgi:hypothetical protein